MISSTKASTIAAAGAGLALAPVRTGTPPPADLFAALMPAATPAGGASSPIIFPITSAPVTPALADAGKGLPEDGNGTPPVTVGAPSTIDLARFGAVASLAAAPPDDPADADMTKAPPAAVAPGVSAVDLLRLVQVSRQPARPSTGRKTDSAAEDPAGAASAPDSEDADEPAAQTAATPDPAPAPLVPSMAAVSPLLVTLMTTAAPYVAPEAVAAPVKTVSTKIEEAPSATLMAVGASIQSTATPVMPVPSPTPPLASPPTPVPDPLTARLARDPALASASGPVRIDAVAPAPVPVAGAQPSTMAAPIGDTPPSRQADLRSLSEISVAAAPVAPPVPAQPAAGTTASAAEVFAAAIQAARRDEKTDARRDADPATLGTITAPVDAARHAVAAASDAASQQSLDMRDQRWPHAMVDRIERLRDDANAADTHIRLVPDQLGAIDISVRKDGDTLHVRFTAEQEATRTLLTDAQPRLSQIAESRGLRLGDTQVGGGNAGQGQAQGQGRPQPQAPATPFTQPLSAIADDETSSDARLA